MAPLLAAVELPLELPLAVLAAPHAAGSPHDPPTPHVVATPLGAAGPIIEAAAQSSTWAAAAPLPSATVALPPLVGNHPPKRPWRKEEDALLLRLVTQHGPGSWSRISEALPGRIGKQCRERWHNHLTPDVKKEKFTAEEDKAIVAAVARHGTRWCQIVKEIPGRSDNAIKNRWNALTRKLQRMRRREAQRESERERATGRSGEQELGGQLGGPPAAQQMLASPNQAAELARQLLASGLDLGLLARTLEGREPDPASAHATDQRRQADAALLVHATLTHEPLEPLAAASDAAEEATGGAPAGAESPSAGLGLLLAAGGEDGDGDGPAVPPHPSPRAVAVVACLGALSGGAPPRFLFEMPSPSAACSTSS
ncbi:hypothetical protein EMIHUDRAFT_441483 [Emiliania huxleyi CCMP1516]|uniref:Uncharacterized protein n=2 Tax=Emiliania huxleyi TaxID=2903 RepID=A0A0D3KCZ2_EMIH1|nr:hypothetical protein EMIHUDRAFT_441483 [Emiliania huxleyi CCMP1516]EOD33627.1 hypothetical protein EMIHUDRAFT_441483 [Emiliania huxleyi CCMP1516]|eukprot:XP_005786056.1 hypothetical protein EMIHUDRAFT_441483 [Emiliania huxleyi CCMP1516]